MSLHFLLFFAIFFKIPILNYSKRILVASESSNFFPCDECLKYRSLLEAISFAFKDSENCTIELLESEYLLNRDIIEEYRRNISDSSADFEIVREIKERSCFVSADIDLDRRLCKETTCLEQEYKLPDNTIIKVNLMRKLEIFA